MKKILILITLTAGLISTSLIKDNTRLLEKSLVNLNDEIISLESNLSEAKLDFEYLTTPKNIYFLAQDFLDDNFTHYKKEQIKILTRKEETLGELFCFFILETILLGKLLNVNPFDQPSVELIKTETKRLLI